VNAGECVNSTKALDAGMEAAARAVISGNYHINNDQ